LTTIPGNKPDCVTPKKQKTSEDNQFIHLLEKQIEKEERRVMNSSNKKQKEEGRQQQDKRTLSNCKYNNRNVLLKNKHLKEHSFFKYNKQ
jgi:hypothetical protein